MVKVHLADGFGDLHRVVSSGQIHRARTQPRPQVSILGDATERESFLKLTVRTCSPRLQLCMVSCELKGGGEKKGKVLMAKAADFIRQSTQRSIPANVFVVMDAHSDTTTGFLQYAGGERSPTYGLPSDVIKWFLGQDLLRAMDDAADQASQAQPPQENEWYTASPFSRGGWRGLLLATCSPTMQVEASFDDVRGLVAQCVPLVRDSSSVTLTRRLETCSTSCLASPGPRRSPPKSEVH